MRACAGCFRDQGPLPLTVDDGAFGKCDLCDRAGVQVWDVALWSDHVARILDMYEPSDAPSARPIHERVAHDWELFTFDDLELVHGFLEAALGGQGVYELLDSREPVLPRYDEDGVAADHKSSGPPSSPRIATSRRLTSICSTSANSSRRISGRLSRASSSTGRAPYRWVTDYRWTRWGFRRPIESAAVAATPSS